MTQYSFLSSAQALPAKIVAIYHRGIDGILHSKVQALPDKNVAIYQRGTDGILHSEVQTLPAKDLPARH